MGCDGVPQTIPIRRRHEFQMCRGSPYENDGGRTISRLASPDYQDVKSANILNVSVSELDG